MSYPVRLKSIKHDLRNWTIDILKENLRILQDTTTLDIKIKLDNIKSNIEMLLYYLTLVQPDKSLQAQKPPVQTLWDLIDDHTIWE